MKTIAFTSAATNYLPKVRKLCASIRQHHPEWEIALALADRDVGAIDFAAEPIDEVIAVEQLDIPDRERWTYFHDIVELSTATWCCSRGWTTCWKRSTARTWR